MLENRNLKLDLAALALAAMTVFLAVSLATYSPADTVGELVFPFNLLHRPDVLVYPASSEVSNACGRWGALAADLAFTSLGVGAYYFAASLAVLDVLLLLRRPIDNPRWRAIGWIASLVGLTTLAAILVPWLSPGPVIGSGGYLGALGRGLLEMHFAFAGGLILAASLLTGGVMLCTDYQILRLGAQGAAVVAAAARSGRRLLAGRAAKPGTAPTATAAVPSNAAGVPDHEVDESLPVKIRGRRLEDEDEDADDGELDVEADAAAEAEDGAADVPDDEDDLEMAGGGDEDQDEADDEHSSAARAASGAAAAGASDSPAAVTVPSDLRVRKPAERAERQEVMAQLEAANQPEEPVDYELPSLELLQGADGFCFESQEKEVRRKAKILEKTFANFGFQVKVVEIETGPVIAQYEVELEAGLRLSKITGLADDLAIALRVPSVRIVAPIPGKNTVGIEVPNEERQMVRLREVMEEANGRTKKMRIPLFVGKDVSGKPLVVDLSTLPHLLIAGRTGTGKSVCLNAIIASILMTRRPDEVRLLMIDPKMVELSCYKTLPHLMHPVVTDMRKAEAILAWAVEKMEERYALLARAGVRHISVYNQLGQEELMDRLAPETDDERKAIPLHLPFIVIVADELADLMMTSGKEVEQHIIRLAQKSRAVGIHLILATQKPTVDVVTGLIKSNLPARIAFQVASRTDSRVVLDEMGADKLLGNGDMLFLLPGTSQLVRGQGTYLSDDEINAVVDFVSTGEQNFVHELVELKVETGEPGQPGALKKRDDLYEAAVDIVIREGRGSVSLLQRALGIGYGRAARLIDFMAEDGIVGPYAGSNAREVLMTLDDWDRMQRASDGPSPAPLAPLPTPSATVRRSNKVLPEPDDDEVQDDDLFDDDAADEEEYEEEEEVADDDYEEVDSDGEQYDDEDDRSPYQAESA